MRRNDISRMSKAELAIREALLQVEELGCHESLTEAVDLLSQAQAKIADYIERPDQHHCKMFCAMVNMLDQISPEGPVSQFMQEASQDWALTETSLRRIQADIASEYPQELQVVARAALDMLFSVPHDRQIQWIQMAWLDKDTI